MVIQDKEKMLEDLRKLHLHYSQGQKIRVSGITESLTDCDGTGVVIWFKGCDKACKGCHNPEVADLNWDTGFSIDLDGLTEYLSKFIDWVDYIVFSGGEPLLQTNAVKAIAQWAKTKGRKTWLYTGNEMHDIDRETKMLMDVIKTGVFIEEQKDLSLKFRGSKNQKLWKKKYANEQGSVFEEWNP